MNRKTINILYWVFTGLFAALMLSSSIPDIMVTPDAVKIVSAQLGYPEYFIRYIGIAKLLGVAAILLPIHPRLKEWAYAGLMFDLASVIYSFTAIGLGINDWWPMLLFVAMGLGSYLFYIQKQKPVLYSAVVI